MTLLFPEWLPGKHSARSNPKDLTGLVVKANGTVVPWTRDAVNMFAYHLVVPQGAKTLELTFQTVTPTNERQGRVVMTREMMNVQFDALALYPAGYASRRVSIQARLQLPEGWKFGTALEVASQEGNVTQFKTIDLETLVDSPIFAGRNYRQFDLDPQGRSPVRLHVVADSPEQLEATPEQIELHRNLVRQADKLFGARHFDHYDFLLALTERMGSIGLEHHRSSENATTPTYFTEWSKHAGRRFLLPHEYSHSWDGKFRRPQDLWIPSFEIPMRTSLLWVYEGQDQYWGYVLAARSGLTSLQETLDALAMGAAASSEGTPGRQWRSLADTTNDTILNSGRDEPWRSWQRTADYYTEGQLIWLDVDTLIRERSGDARSLDDFARRFFGTDDGSWTPRTYTFEDVVKVMQEVEPYDWAAFLHARIRDVTPKAPLDGLTRGGYRLIFTETPTEYFKSMEGALKGVDLAYSLGVVLDPEGAVRSVTWNGPAFRAGLKTGDMIIAVNGLAYRGERLKAAITAAKSGDRLAVLIKDGEHYRSVPIDYHDGLRYPRLERIAGAPDRLSAIYAPR